MQILPSNISCGIAELLDIGCGYNYPTYHGDKDMDAAYERVMAPVMAAMVIASVTTKQKLAIALLRKKGFEQIGGSKRNPNSGNQILLFVKRLNNKRLGKQYRAD